MEHMDTIGETILIDSEVIIIETDSERNGSLAEMDSISRHNGVGILSGTFALQISIHSDYLSI